VSLDEKLMAEEERHYHVEERYSLNYLYDGEKSPSTVAALKEVKRILRRIEKLKAQMIAIKELDKHIQYHRYGTGKKCSHCQQWEEMK
jgi:hypothetical protein